MVAFCLCCSLFRAISFLFALCSSLSAHLAHPLSVPRFHHWNCSLLLLFSAPERFLTSLHVSPRVFFFLACVCCLFVVFVVFFCFSPLYHSFVPTFPLHTLWPLILIIISIMCVYVCFKFVRLFHCHEITFSLSHSHTIHVTPLDVNSYLMLVVCWCSFHLYVVIFRVAYATTMP